MNNNIVKITPEKLERMKQLRNEGKSYRVIGADVGLHARTVRYHLDPREKANRLGILSTHTKIMRKFYWWVRRVHPEWLDEFTRRL